MAQNLATKYSDKVAERFSTTSKTKPGVNQDYDWQGSNAGCYDAQQKLAGKG